MPMKPLLCALCLLVVPFAAAAPRTILFIDDEDVLDRSGAKRRVGEFRKFEGNPVIAPDRPWESSTIGWNSQYRDPKTGKFQLWYQAHSQRNDDRRIKNTVCYAESTDGQTWVKPALGLFSYYDVRDTNIVLIGNGGYGDRYCCSVLVDEREPDPARRYKMVYYDWMIGADEKRGAGSHVAFSPDGIHWTKHGPMVMKTSYGAKGVPAPYRDEGVYFEEKQKNGTVRKSWRVPLSMSDAVDVIADPRLGGFVAYGKMWIPGPDGSLGWKHAMGRAESADLIHWSKPELILVPDERDAPMREFHTSPVFYHRGLYLSLNQILDRRAGTIDLELMSSRDGRRWERPYAGTPAIARGQGAVFDAGSLFSNATPIEVGDEVRFYYGAYRGTAVGGVGLDRQKVGAKDYFSGIGYAAIRRDRFVALFPDPASSVRNPPPAPKAGTPPPPPNTVAQVTLKALDLRGVTRLQLNADASRGAIRVEVLDEDGYRLRGFAKEDAVPVRGDGLDLEARWQQKSLADLPAGKYLLRVHLDRADFYAVTLR